MPPLPFKINLKDTSLHFSLNFLGLIFLSIMPVQCSLKISYSTMCEKIFQIYGVRIPRKCIDSRNFYSCLSKLASNICHHTLGKNYLFPQDSIHSKICFPQQQNGVEETVICFIKLQSEIMKMTENIRFFLFGMIFSFFKCDRFTVL